MYAAKKMVLVKKPAEAKQDKKPTTVAKTSSSPSVPDPEGTPLDTLETLPETLPDSLEAVLGDTLPDTPGEHEQSEAETTPDTQPECTQTEVETDAPPVSAQFKGADLEGNEDAQLYYMGWKDASSQATKKRKLFENANSRNPVKKAEGLEDEEDSNTKQHKDEDEKATQLEDEKATQVENEKGSNYEQQKDEEDEELKGTQLEATSLATRWSLDAQL